MATMTPMLISLNQVLTAYIRTGLRPLYGKQAYLVDAEGRDLRDAVYQHDDNPVPERGPAVAACPIGVLCFDKGEREVESGTFGEHYYNKETHEGNICWTDGFISAWEDGDAGYHPEFFDYHPENNPEGLVLYKLGYVNGQMIRQGFINLGLRAA